ncbi:MAG: alpha/beta fold hydrolase [Prevotellaceae bacterium]|jgi:pimeloyl-ACP methyl ester carboxylesterase|nr:alpha/beta fold hydrolase [Prevotellaceae bacterium]
MQLFFRKFGNIGANIIILHGLYGCSDNWVSIAKNLSQANQVFAVDLRNHGRSPHSAEHSYEAMCSDLIEFIEYHKIQKPVIIGHSIGGRCAALFAKQFPDCPLKIIIVDISPFDCENQAEILTFHTNILKVLTSVNLNEIHSRYDVAVQISKKITDRKLQNFLLKNLYRTPNGNFLWRFNLPAILNNVNNIICGSLKKGENINIQIPSLFIAGEKSNYIVTSDIKIITSAFFNTKIEIIPEAGHWIHAEQRENLVNCIQKFINNQM